MTLPLTDKYAAMSTEELLAKSHELSAEANKKWLNDNAAEADWVTQESARRNAAGSFDSVVKPAVDDYAKQAEADAGPDPKSVSESIAEFRTMLNGMFSPTAVAANASPGAVPQFVAGNRLSGGIGVTPMNFFELSAKPGAAKTPFGEFDCQRNIFQALAGAVGQVALSALSNYAKALQGILMSMEFLIKSVEGIKEAIQNLSVQSLLAILISQDLILQQIISVVSQMNSILGSIEDKDYSVIHVVLLRREQVRLEQAISKLNIQKALLLARNPFDYDLWSSAQKDVEATAKAFCGFDLEAGVSLKLIQILGLRAYLQVLLKLLKRQNDLRSGLETSLLNFSNNFEAATQLDNLYVPIVGMIKCRLEVILEAMESSIKKNEILAFLVKEKFWCLELMAISAFMKFSGKAKLPDLLNAGTGMTAIQDASNAVLGFLQDQRSALMTTSRVAEVLDLGNAYVALTGDKLKSNTDSVAIISLGEAVIGACNDSRANGSIFGGLLGAFSSSVATGAAVAVAAVGGLMEFASDQNLDSFVDNIKKGKIGEALGVDQFTSSLSAQAGSVLGRAASTINGAPDSVSNELSQASTAFIDEARSLGLISELDNQYADKRAEELRDEVNRRKDGHQAITAAAEPTTPDIDSELSFDEIENLFDLPN